MDARKKLMVATIALNDRRLPDITAIVGFLNGNFTELLGVVREAPNRGGNPSHGWVLDFDDGHVVLTISQGPSPWPELAAPCRTAWWWPDAEAALRGHRAKIDVALFGTRLDPLHAALATTAFTAAVAATTDAAGIRWDKGWVVQPPEHFVDSALASRSGHLPTDCWVHLGLSVQGDKTTVMTTGMAAFRLPEIEAVDVAFAPQLVVGRVTSFVAYLLQNGPVVMDGHSIGYSDQEQIRVRRCRSSFRPALDVFRLEFKKLLVPV